MFIPTSIRIVLDTVHPNKKGLCPIVLRFIQNRKPYNISLRKYIPPEAWENKGGMFVKEKGEGSVKSAKALNHFLNEMLSKARKIIYLAEAENSSLTFEQFREQMISTKNQDFYAFCEVELNRRLDSGKFSSETIRNHRSKLAKLKKFKTKLSFNDLTPEYLQCYEQFMRVEMNNTTNTVFTAMKFIRAMLNAARSRGLTDVYPFADYKFVYKKNTRNRLYATEVELLQKLYDNQTLSNKHQKVLRHFLFVCYTGLSWGDLVALDYSEIKNLNGIYVINRKRSKTDHEFTVALIAEARAMIDLTKTEGTVFGDLVSNQKANRYIQEVIKNTTINKHISFHCGRHSFGTISLNKGIPREVVQKMMGHAKPEMTDLYSKVMDSYIVSEMEKWKNGTSNASFKEKLSDKTLEKSKQIRTLLTANRIASGFDEVDIARKIGVTENDYKLMEKGEVQFGLAYLIEICEILGVKLKAVV